MRATASSITRICNRKVRTGTSISRELFTAQMLLAVIAYRARLKAPGTYRVQDLYEQAHKHIRAPQLLCGLVMGES